MRWTTLVGILIGGLIAIQLISALGGGAIGPDVRVIVLTTDPVRLVLPVDVGAAFIESRLRGILAASSDEQRDPRMARYVKEVEGDTQLIRNIAQSGFEHFAAGTAAGVAYALYGVAIESEEVVLFSVTVELLPSYYGVGETLAHEDGHWIINSGVAQRCGPQVVRRSASRIGSRTETAIIDSLQDIDTRVHGEYHRLVVNASPGQHPTAAIQSLDTVIGPSCERTR